MKSLEDRIFLWFLASCLWLFLSALYQSALIRPFPFSWLKIHLLFIVTREVPLLIWGWYFWIKKAWRWSCVYTVVMIVVTAIAARISFQIGYDLVQVFPHVLYGDPHKPWWWIW